MNEYDVRRFAQVMALVAQMEGMKAFNQQRQVAGESPGYNQDSFEDISRQLGNLAYSHNEQL